MPASEIRNQGRDCYALREKNSAEGALHGSHAYVALHNHVGITYISRWEDQPEPE